MDNMIEDALALCLEAQINKTSQKYQLIATESPTSRFENHHSNDSTCLIYKNATVPFYLEKEGVLKVIDREWINPVFYRPKGFFRVEFDFDKLNQWIVNRNHNVVNSDNLDPSFLWEPDLKKCSGILYTEHNQSMKFRGSFFGGFNILYERRDHDVSSNELRDAIATCLKKPNNKPESINLADWRFRLKMKKDFSKYFELVFTSPNMNKLIFIHQK